MTTVRSELRGDPLPLPDGLTVMLDEYLSRQRWFATTAADSGVAVLDSRLISPAEELPRAWWAVVGADGARYQLLIGERQAGDVADFLHGHESAVIGSTEGSYFYDATLDPELSKPLLRLVCGFDEHPERVRPIGVEQSNSSLVYDDRIILKIFRRLSEGPNQDVETTKALYDAGFEQVATPIASLTGRGTDLMFAQEFLTGGSEGWALALTSLRDYLSHTSDDPREAGGDFSGEATRLGRMTARMHVVLAAIYGVGYTTAEAGEWTALVDDIERRIRIVPGLERDIKWLIEHLRQIEAPIPSIRVHGDYHLGQVMRTDGGWFVLDFEGEPARPSSERLAKASPLKDVTGMLRSLHYASRFVLRERVDSELDRLEGRAELWEIHNRDAFLSGYRSEEGIESLLPAGDIEDVVIGAYELDKALYELDYERSYRPDWVDIPLDALGRIITRLSR